MKIITKRKPKPLRIVLYGDSGVGKSTWAANAPNPIFLDIEKGLDGIDKDVKVQSTEINSLTDIKEALVFLKDEKHDYKTVVIDSLDWLERAIHANICADFGKKTILELSFGKGYSIALAYWRRFLERLTELRDQRDMVIIFISHCHIKPFNSPTHDTYDRFSIKLHKSASELISEFSDCIFFAASKLYIDKQESVFGKTITRAKDTGQRVLYTESSASFLAKSRYKLPKELPLEYSAFERAFNNTLRQEKKHDAVTERV